MKPTLEHRLDIGEYLIDTDSCSEPVIARTGVTVGEILSKLAAGWFLGDIMAAYNFPTDKPILAAVAYADFLPPHNWMAIKLHQYREYLRQKVISI